VTAGRVAHRPTTQLQATESGSFHTEAGRAPQSLPPDAVEDVPAESALSARFHGSCIRNLDAVADQLCDPLAGAPAAHEVERCGNRADAPPYVT